MDNPTHGVVPHSTARPTDYLYRISLKCLILDDDDNVLVVKETGRDWWDLPGGGMDHHEGFRSAIAREMMEEVSLRGDFDFEIIDVDEPAFLTAHNFFQVRLIFHVRQHDAVYAAGDDGDEIAFLPITYFEQSTHEVERRIIRYFSKAKSA